MFPFKHRVQLTNLLSDEKWMQLSQCTMIAIRCDRLNDVRLSKKNDVRKLRFWVKNGEKIRVECIFSPNPRKGTKRLTNIHRQEMENVSFAKVNTTIAVLKLKRFHLFIKMIVKKHPLRNSCERTRTLNESSLYSYQIYSFLNVRMSKSVTNGLVSHCDYGIGFNMRKRNRITWEKKKIIYKKRMNQQ